MKRLLLGYNLTRNCKVELVSDIDLWTILPLTCIQNPFAIKQEATFTRLEEIDSDDIKLVADPRLGAHYLGYRLLTRLGGAKIEDIGPYLKVVDGGGIRLYEGSTLEYARLRYQLGVLEGNAEMRSGSYLPFELNGDLLNAVSLNKGKLDPFFSYLHLFFYSHRSVHIRRVCNQGLLS